MKHAENTVNYAQNSSATYTICNIFFEKLKKAETMEEKRNNCNESVSHIN
jgi:hypothetical protein